MRHKHPQKQKGAAVDSAKSGAFAQGQWTASLPVGQPAIHCGEGDGLSCAARSFLAFWGPPTDGALACFYSYNGSAKVTLATCLGRIDPFIRDGRATLECLNGDPSRTGTDICAAPADKNTDRCTHAANPVITTSGVKTETVVDFSTNGPAPLVFSRSYFSETGVWGSGEHAGIQASRLGRVWRSNLDASLVILPDVVYAYLPDATQLRFLKTGSVWVAQGYNRVTQSWASAPNVTATLSQSGSSWLLRLSNDTTYNFDSDGRLAAIQYRGGYAQLLKWENDKNTEISDNLGRNLIFAYGANGLLSQMTDSDGRVTKYTYIDKSGIEAVFPGVIGTHIEYALDKVIYPDNTPGTDTDNPTVQYLYEDASFRYALTGLIDERAVRYATWNYDGAGRVATSEHAGGVQHYAFAYDTVNSRTTVTNPLGKDTIYHFDPNVPGLSLLTQIEGVASPNCPASNTSFGYDSNRFINEVTDAEGRITSITNDARGLPNSITRGSGTPSAAMTTYTWDPTYRVPAQIVEPGLTTSLTWGLGRLTQFTQTDTTTTTVPYSTNGQTRTWRFGYYAPGLLASVDGPLSGAGDTVRYRYNNANGFLTSVTNELGQLTQVTAWDSRGNPKTIVDPNGVTSSLTYDERGRFKSLTVDPTGLNAQTAVDYDPTGDITKTTRPNGSFLQYTYDNARRLTKIADNLGRYIEYDYDNMSDVTARRIKTQADALRLSQTATYDELGRLLSFIGAASQTWTFGYDKTDNLVSVTDPRANLYQRAFDSLNRLIGETDEDNGTVTLTRNSKDEITNYSDPRSLNTSYVRNGFGDIIQRTSADSGTTVYVYNALAKPTQVTDGRGVITDLTYDNAGRLLTKQYPAAPSENITYTWDSTTGGNKGVGRITRIDDASGSIEWTYDALGQKTQEKKTIAAIAYTIGYAYDLDGNVTEITYPSGRTATFTRNSTAQVTSVTTRKDSVSPIVTVAFGIAYRPFGDVQGLDFGNGLELVQGYTQDYLIASQRVRDPSTLVTAFNRSYAFGDGVNLTAITDNLNAARTETYAYTATNRLQQGAGIWGTLSWSYNLVGNRTSEVLTSGGTTTNTYNYPATSNRLSTIAQGATTVRSFSYDGAGNVTADTRGSTAYNYRYNNRARLDRLTVGATVTANYTYDGLERMAIRTTQNMSPAGTTHYLYDLAGRLLAEADNTGATLREYIWLDDLPLAVVADVNTATPQLYFVHADQVKRPLKMTDASKAIVWDAVYRPFGEIVSITGNASNNLRFPGQYFLIEDGLHYNWYRHYEPTIGRYEQPDSQEFVDGPSLYAYAVSAPTQRTDPTGQAIAVPIAGAALICARFPQLCAQAGRAVGAAAAGAAVQAWNYCRKTTGFDTGGSGGGEDECRDRWIQEYNRCVTFKPWGYRYQLACEARANDRLRLCNRNGGKPDPNEPPEYDFNDIPRDSPRR